MGSELHLSNLSGTDLTVPCIGILCENVSDSTFILVDDFFIFWALTLPLTVHELFRTSGRISTSSSSHSLSSSSSSDDSLELDERLGILLPCLILPQYSLVRLYLLFDHVDPGMPPVLGKVLV